MPDKEWSKWEKSSAEDESRVNMKTGEIQTRNIMTKEVITPDQTMDHITEDVTDDVPVKGQKKSILKAPAHIQNVRTLVDGTIRTTIDMARELPSEEMTLLFELKRSGGGWLLYAPNDMELTMKDIPDQKATTSATRKSPSERMYAVFFLRWKHMTDQSTPFDVWYAGQMNILINNLKKGLPEQQRGAV